jgi:hypothetical protein
MAEYYEIVIKGHIDSYRARWFEDVEIKNLPTGEAVLCCNIGDDNELAVLLDQICSLGMPLLNVKRRQPPRV